MTKKRSKRANGDGSITFRMRNGKKYYTASITLGYNRDGTQARETKSSYKQGEVINWLNDMKSRRTQLSIYSDKQTLEGFANYWLFNVKAPTVKANTLERYESLIRNHIATTNLWNRQLTKLRFEDFEQLFANYGSIDPKTNDPMVSLHSRKFILRVLRAMFKHAMILQKIQLNPTMTVALPKEDTAIKPTYSQTEQQIIINALTSSIEDRAILLALATGLRQGEILGLQWKDLKNNTLNINKQQSYVKQVNPDGTRTNYYQITPPKTSSSKAIVPIPYQIAMIFERYREDDETFIFSENGKIIDCKKLRRRLYKIQEENGLPHKTFHQLRHAFATRLFETGVDLKTVSGLMRHKDIATTANIYTHLSDEKKNKASELMSQFLTPEITIKKTKKA
ncbi:tyrosine-type recombinase/integrase [Ezakiella peruensis]|uniref:tyrosine-type recombinase/integrase n=1 Tax=Ezakiella peruensis TaxID=1464038 RepID=UPI000C1B3551|nr:site-specific integrase [Ezakiella peruensis]